MPKNLIMMMQRLIKPQPGKKLLVLRIHFLNLKIMCSKKPLQPNKPLEFLILQIQLARTPKRLPIG